MNYGNALVIGSNGGIGQQIVKQLCKSGKFSSIHAVSRTSSRSSVEGVQYQILDSTNEHAVRDYCLSLQQSSTQFTRIFCCVGVLHGKTNRDEEIQPEKRLEDISANKLMSYFAANTIVPAIWLKYAHPLFKGDIAAKFVFLSARVGSISDNKLGGWYGYRASKAALNMLIKTAQIEYQRRAKNVSLVSYHPGTVDTALSKPFQANVPTSKLFTPEFTVNQLLSLLGNLEAGVEAHYIDWQGNKIPW